MVALASRTPAGWSRVSHALQVALAIALVGVFAQGAQARREVTFNYPYSRVWTSVVRLMRVDFGCTITEKDKDDGYFLFEYPDHGKTFPGSVELVASKDEDVETVRVVIQVPAMPSYVEGMMMDRLARKLEQEFGAPKEPKRPGAKDKDDKDDPDRPDDTDKPRPNPPPKAKPGAGTSPRSE